MALTFTWHRAFPDTHHDFVAEDRGQHVGRIMRNGGGPNVGTWFWTCTGCQPGEAELKSLNSEIATRHEAIEALSEAWSRAWAWSARTGMLLV